MRTEKNQVEIKDKRISRLTVLLIAVILAGGMLIGMSPVRALAAQLAGDTYIEETEQIPPETTAPKDERGAGSLTAELGGISKSFSLTVTPPPAGRAVTINIGTADQLQDFATNINNGTYTSDSNAVLTADINLSGISNWTSIGTSAHRYTGTFDGGGYTIFNMKLNASSSSGDQNELYTHGLFGLTSGNAVIKNLVMDNCTVTSNTTNRVHETIGTIVGYAEGNTKLINCGVRNSKVEKTGTNTYFSAIGGLVGDLRAYASVTDSYFRGSVINRGTANTSSGAWVGGIAGRQCNDTGRVSNSYTAVTIANNTTGLKYAAYIIGMNTARACITDCYYDSTVSTAGLSNPGNGTGRTTAQMRTPDFTWRLNATSTPTSGRYYPNQIWNYQMTAAGSTAGNAGYPDFKNNVKDWQAIGTSVKAPSSVSGFYQLASAADFAWFMSQVNSGSTTINGIVTAALDMSGTAYGGSTGTPLPWVSIGKSGNYQGTFQGNRKTISYLSGPPVFGTVNNGRIETIVLDNTCKIKGSGGIVTNLINGIVMDCLNGGTVSSTAWGGGIVGTMKNGTVERCGVTGSVSTIGTNNSLGGIVGWINGTDVSAKITNCYYRDGTITNSGGSSSGIAYVSSDIASKTTIAGCYFAGTLSARSGDRAGIAVVSGSGIPTVTDCIYLENKTNPYTGPIWGTELPSENLKSWYGAYLLNGKKTGSGTAWTVSQPKTVYPEWGTLGAATDWGAVGEMAEKPQAVTSSGTIYYIIDSPEDLAWLAYQVNHTASASSEDYNALIVADIDLFGEAYTGKRKTGNAATDAAAALAWIPIGLAGSDSTAASADAVTIPASYYKGKVHGVVSATSTVSQLRTIDCLRVDGVGGYNGLFGYTYNATLTSLEVGAHSRVQARSKQMSGGIAAVINQGTVADCSNRGQVSMYGSSWDMGQGGIVGTLRGGSVLRCKNFGSIKATDTRWGYIGGIVGYAPGSKQITGCTNEGTVTNGYYAGGIAGYAASSSKVADCTNAGTATNGERVGGIVGNLSASSITNSKNTANIKAGSPTYKAASGGIVGYAIGASAVSGCDNTGAIGLTYTIKDNSAGGVAGCIDNSTIEKNSSTGAVSIGSSTVEIYAGGVAGRMLSGTLRNNYSRGNISGGTGTVYCGGVTGAVAGGTASSNYFAGRITGTGISAGVYGIHTGGTVTNNFFDALLLPGIADSTGKGGRTTAQMKQWGCAYQLNGAPDLSNVSQTVWRKAQSDSENSGYPVFATAGTKDVAANWSEPGAWVDAFGTKPAGDGGTTPYQITSPEQLAWLSYKVNTDSAGYRSSNADMGKRKIDLFGSRFTGRAAGGGVSQALTWVPIGVYAGTLTDGSLENLYIPNGAASVGFIQTLDGGHVSGLQVRGSVSATANTTNRMAGIVALAQNNASIRYCMNWIPIDARRQAGANYTGGIVGQLKASTVEYCANFANVTDTNLNDGLHNGGIAGSAEGGSRVNSCYNAGAASNASDRFRAGSGHIVSPRNLNATVTDCYYDSDKAGLYSNPVANVTGLTTAQMKTFRATQLLNTDAKTGSNRIWYTSSDASPTAGYPSFVVTNQTSRTFTPVEAANPTYGTVNLSYTKFLYLEEVAGAERKLLDSSKAVTLVAPGDIKTNYNRYGTDNADKKLAFGMGALDLSTAARNAAAPTSMLSFYNAAAYSSPADRYFVLGVDAGGTVSEWTLKVAAVTGKTLDVELPVNASIALKPGLEDKANSNSLLVHNKNTYPVDFNIASVKPWEKGNNSATHKLVPVAQSMTVTGDEAHKENVHLWIGNVSYNGSVFPNTYYYNPSKGTIPFGAKLGASGGLGYLYWMDYGAVLSDNTGRFGYDVLYEYSISKEDADKNSVKIESK